MKKLFTFIVGAAVSLGAYAQGFDSGGLRYSVLSPDDKTCAVTGYDYLDADLVIPERVVYDGEDYSVTRIASWAITGNGAIRTLTLPSTLEVIESCAFYNLYQLSSIAIPNSVREIGSSSFAYCHNLSSVELGTSLEFIYSEAFWDCPVNAVYAYGETPAQCEPSFTRVFTSNPVVAVSEELVGAYQAVWNGADVKPNIDAERVDFDPQVYTLRPGQSVQLNCVTDPINAAVKYVSDTEYISVDNNGLATADKLKGGYWAYVTATSLNGLTAQCRIITESLEEFDSNGFVYVIIPDTDNEVALIRYNSDATVITIPETVDINGTNYTVTAISDRVFPWESPIEEVVIPASIKEIRKYNFIGCNSLKKVTIEDSSEPLVIAYADFCDNEKLSEVYVGRSMKRASDEYCFGGNGSLTRLVLGPEVSSLSDRIFENCNRLSLVQSKNPVPPTLGEYVFGWNNFSIIVPAESVDAYKAAWTQYADNISEAIEATSLSFEIDEVTLYNGQSAQLKYTVEPEDAIVLFSSSNGNLVNVDQSGRIDYGWWTRESGEAVITASTLNGLTEECKVTAKHWLTFPQLVTPQHENKLGLTLGSTYQVEVIKAEELADTPIAWSSYNTNVAEVDENGNITAVGYGNTEVVASVEVPDMGWFEYYINVDVYAEPTEINVENTEVSVIAEYETQLPFTLEPQDEPNLNSEMNWTVADPEMAEVVKYWNNTYGVRGLKLGKTTITGKTVNDLTVEFNVTVKARIEDIKFPTDRMYIGVEQSKQLQFTVVPEVNNQTFSYISNDENVASIDEDGVVTGHNYGATNIGIIAQTPWEEEAVITWYTVEVVVLPESVSFKGSSDIEGQINSWTTIPLEFTPDNPDVCKHIDWTAENPEIAYVDSWDNTFRGDKFGTTAIKGVAVNGDILEGTVTVTGIEFTEDGEPIRSKEVILGDEFQFGVNVYPLEILDNIIYYSDDENVATVDEDKNVKAVGYGRAWINASSWIANNENERKNYYGGFQVIVRPTEGIALSKDNYVLRPDTWGNYLYLVSAADVYTGHVTWTSSDENVVSFEWTNSSEANLRYVGPGVATVTATDQNGNVAECQVTCLGLGLTVNGESVYEVNVVPGDQFHINVNAYPAELLDNLAFESYNSSVATVDEYGNVDAQAYGSAYIRAYSWTDYEGETLDFARGINVVVRPSDGIAFNTNSIVMRPGDEWSYLSLASALGVEPGEISWTSSDANVVNITWWNNEQAELHYTGPGVATVTATDQNGNVAECQVTCLGIQPTVYGAPRDYIDVVPGEQFQIEVNAYPAELRDNLTFESYNSSVATVSESGWVNAESYGTAWIHMASWADYEGESLEYSKDLQVNVRPYDGIVLNTNNVVLRPGEGTYLQVIGAAGLDTGDITWSSSDYNVVSFDWTGYSEANIRFVGPGRATITARDQNGNEAYCEVLCVQVSLSESNILMGIDQTRQISVNVEPAGLDYYVDWYTYDWWVASVSEDGTITPNGGYGTTQIGANVYTNDGTWLGSASADVEVIDWIYVSEIELDPEYIVIRETGESVQVSATVYPYDAIDKSLTWSTSNSSVATVDENGLVTIVGHGYAEITAAATDGSGVTATCVVGEPVKSITLSETTRVVTEGETIRLYATVSPSNVANGTVVWTTNNPFIASVDANGVVTALRDGTAIITATAVDGSGVSADCHVIVIPSEIPEIPVAVESIEISQTEWEAKVGDTLELTAAVVPADANNKQISWSSSDESVATVSYDGVVTAVGIGEAVITAFVLDNLTEVKAECVVKVIDSSSSPSDSGVAGFEADDNALYDVFTQQGILLKRNCTAEDIKQLQSGIYIIRCGSTVKTVYLRN